MSSSDETPAPTFEELPLEKGAVLELHSIGHPDFDGLIVEYMGVDKPTGKFRALALQESGNVKVDQAMLVKPRACRRPAIKPLRLRKMLVALVQNIVSTHTRDFRDISLVAHQARLGQLLKSDPCCPLALLLLGESLLAGLGEFDAEPDLRQRDVLELVVRYCRRAYANAHAYEDIDNISSYLLSNTLTRALKLLGRYKTDVRMLQTALNKYSRLAMTEVPLSVAGTYCNKVTSRLYILGRYSSEERYDKKVKALILAAEDLLSSLRICANIEAQSNCEAELVSFSLAKVKHILHVLIADANNVQRSLGLHSTINPSRSDYEESVHDFVASKDRIIYLSTQASRLVDDLINACTVHDGTLKFIDDEYKQGILHLKECALAQIESLKSDDE